MAILTEDLFPTHASILAPAAVEARILCHYDFPLPVRVHFYRKGINDTYLVITGSGPYFLRIYQYQWRSKEEIEAEVDFIIELKRAGLSVSYPVKKNDGRYLHRISTAEGERFAVLFTAAEGILHKNPTSRQSYQLGRTTGQLHEAADGQPPYHRFALDVEYLLRRPLASIRSVFGDRRDDVLLLQRLTDKLQGVLERSTYGRPEYGLCHGDLHTENVHFDQDDRPTLFDCDCFGYGWRAYDLATFLWSRYLFASTEAAREESWQAFLAGYAEVRPLPSTMLKTIPYFVAMRQIWVMGLHTSEATLHYGRRWLDEKYVAKHFGFIRSLAGELRV